MSPTYSIVFFLYICTFTVQICCANSSIYVQENRCIPCPVTQTGNVAQFCNVNITNQLCVAGDENIGGDLFVCGLITSSLGFSGPGSGGGAGTTGATGATGPTGSFGFTAPFFNITGTTPSTGCDNGALVVAGGVGIGGNLNVCGQVHIFNTGVSTGCTGGALVIDGGVGIGGNLNVCGTITASGFGGPSGAAIIINPNGNVSISSTSQSTGCTGGAFVVDGGVGIGGDLNVCGTITSASGFSGPINSANYAFFYSTNLQTATSGFSDASFDAMGPTNGWVITGPGTILENNSQSGVYYVQYTGAWSTSQNALSNVAMRATLDGSEISGSYSTGYVSQDANNAILTLTHGFLVTYTAGQDLQIQFITDGVAQLINVGGASGDGPVVEPSLTVTIIRIA